MLTGLGTAPGHWGRKSSFRENGHSGIRIAGGSITAKAVSCSWEVSLRPGVKCLSKDSREEAAASWGTAVHQPTDSKCQRSREDGLDGKICRTVDL